jgi:hypothetical protein
MLRFLRKQGCLNQLPEDRTRPQGTSTLVPEDTKLEADTRQEIDARLETAEFEAIAKQLRGYSGLDFEADHARALLNREKPGAHHPDNLQLIIKAHKAGRAGRVHWNGGSAAGNGGKPVWKWSRQRCYWFLIVTPEKSLLIKVTNYDAKSLPSW